MTFLDKTSRFTLYLDGKEVPRGTQESVSLESGIETRKSYPLRIKLLRTNHEKHEINHLHK